MQTIIMIELARAKRMDAAHSGRVCLSDRTASKYENNLWSPNVMDITAGPHCFVNGTWTSLLFYWGAPGSSWLWHQQQDVDFACEKLF